MAAITKELVISYTNDNDIANVTVFQAKHVNQIKKLAEAHPDEVKIYCSGDGNKNDGMTVAYVPKKYCRISFGERAKREMTEEQKAAASERIKKMHEARKNKQKEKDEEVEEGWL